MQYNPQYCTIVVRNTDGSGYLRQFKTLSEAKDAYASISASGASVYLYQPPTRSLASFEAGEGIPDYNNGTTYDTGDQVKFQGKVYRLINFIGAAGYDPATYANLWTEVTSFTPPNIPPISNNESEVIESGVTRSPFTFTPNDNVATQTMSKVGCVIGKIIDADGQEVFAPVYPRYIFQENGVTVEEKLGEINTNGCYLPNGFKIEKTGNQNVYSEVQVLNSLDYGGSVYGPYYEVWSLLGWGREYIKANGDGTTRVDETIGIPKTTQQGDFDNIEWEFYQNGDIPYKLTSNINFSDWTKVGQPIPNGRYLVTYKIPPSDEIHSGYWIASIINAETSPKVKWVFEPVEPDQPPPPPCSVIKKTTNPITGVQEDDCDPDVVYPFTVEEDCEPPVTVDLEGQTITLGTNKKTGMDNGYGDVVWGPCSGMVYVPNATLILSGESLNYFSDGQGSYYTEDKNPNPCDSAGTIISSEQTDITVQINAGTYTVGYSYERTVADGNCGSSLEIGSEYVPSGTLLTEDSENKYYSDGAGSYYSEPIVNCDPSGTYISESTESSTIYLSEPMVDVIAGSFVVTTYADGNCGTYTSNGETTWYASETQIYSDSSYNYYSNGSGGYYYEIISNCDAYGTYISGENTGDLTVYVSELQNNYTVGSSNSSTYADGNCGTYTESGNSYYSYGTQIASDGVNYNFFSDGNGGYYSEPITSCDAYGTYISGSNSDATIYISEMGSSYTVGSNYENVYADGNCGTYTESGTSWSEYGTLITSGNGYNFYSDGNGGYYSETVSSCDAYGTYISGFDSTTTIYISELGMSYDAGTNYEATYADGNCGTYTESGTNWYSYGTLIASDSYYNYLSDGNGSYYSESI